MEMFGVGPPGVLLVIAYIPGIRELHEQWTQSYVLLSFFGGFLVGGDQEKDKIIFDSFIASFGQELFLRSKSQRSSCWATSCSHTFVLCRRQS